MRRKWKVWCMPFFGALLVLSTYAGQQGVKENEVVAEKLDSHDQSIHKKGNGQDKSINVIPSFERGMKETTNLYNLTANVGNSSLHDAGISSQLESRLSGEGIPGIKVFVIDDTIILAGPQLETASTRYDERQNKVLKNTVRLSGKGNLDGVDQFDHLAKAKELMSKGAYEQSF